jgi:hypothetical protein
MNSKDVIRQLVEFCHVVTRGYIDDLTDQDLLVRSVPTANHIAWQLGHLIASDQQMLAGIGQPAPALPRGFAEAHTKETSTSNDPAKFFKKADYIRLMDLMKPAALAAIDATPEEKLNEPAPEAMREYAPTIAAVLSLFGTHWLMHAGQFVPIRRTLGTPAMY